MSAYFTQADLEARVGANIVVTCFDDDNDGVADASALARIIDDASSFCDGYYAALGLIPFQGTPPATVKRLALDVAVAFVAQRHPEVLHRDWEALLDAARRELEDVRKGKTQLGLTAPDAEPIQNTVHASGVSSSDPDATQRQWDDMGVF